MTTPRQRQHSAPAHSSTAVTLHFKERNSQKQPLYRPAALRRNGSISHDLFQPSPPASPSLATAEAKQSWLSSLAPWSPSASDAPKELGGALVRGKMLPRAHWKPDEGAEQCADPDCTQRFDLMHRRHHCRTCGDIFCGAHSSRSTLLWPSTEDDAVPAFTPRGTPRQTPRSSAVDLPSLVAGYSVSPTSSYISTATVSSASSSTHSSTPTSSPPNPSSMPVSARVCDRCYFSAPTATGSCAPLLTPPIVLPSHVPWAFGAASSSSRPLTLRHPRGSSTSRSRSRASSPSHLSHSPPGLIAVATSRSRQGSAASSSSAASAANSLASEYSTPSTSVEGLPYTASSSSLSSKVGRSSSLRGRACQPYRPRAAFVLREEDGEGSDGGTSTETELRPSSAEADSSVPSRPSGLRATDHAYADESDDSDTDSDDERHAQLVRERRREQQEFGSVHGGPWASWATF
ncbi:hypothetical protein JCM8097_006512 [Rhodosporidiobolus ruineniae]